MNPARRGLTAKWSQEGEQTMIHERYPEGFDVKVETDYSRPEGLCTHITITDEGKAPLFSFTIYSNGHKCECFWARRLDTYRPRHPDVGEGTTQRLRGGRTFPKASIARGGVPSGPRPGPRMSKMCCDSRAGQ